MGEGDFVNGYDQLVAEETLILEATEAICERMEQSSDLTRKALAKRLGRSKGFVSQILRGDRNMTLRTLAQFADALSCRVEVKLAAIPAPPGEKPARYPARCGAVLGDEAPADPSGDPSHCALPEGHDGLHAPLPVVWQLLGQIDGPWTDLPEDGEG